MRQTCILFNLFQKYIDIFTIAKLVVMKKIQKSWYVVLSEQARATTKLSAEHRQVRGNPRSNLGCALETSPTAPRMPDAFWANHLGQVFHQPPRLMDGSPHPSSYWEEGQRPGLRTSRSATINSASRTHGATPTPTCTIRAGSPPSDTGSAHNPTNQLDSPPSAGVTSARNNA